MVTRRMDTDISLALIITGHQVMNIMANIFTDEGNSFVTVSISRAHCYGNCGDC